MPVLSGWFYGRAEKPDGTVGGPGPPRMHLLLCSTNVNKLDTDQVGPIENRKPRADAANGSNDTQKTFPAGKPS
ncbi:unnamed protein product [Arctogadus glacialis]